ncbi:MAG: DUF4860 domain-containing protein [Longicatena sp.]
MKEKHSIDVLFSLSLFGVFVVCSFLILLLQTNGYHSILEQSKENAQSHTPLAYIQSIVRANDESNHVSIFSQQGIEGIKISDESQENTTYIYTQDKELKELRLASNLTPDFTTGSTMFEINALHVIQEEQKLQVVLEDRLTKTTALTIPLRAK